MKNKLFKSIMLSLALCFAMCLFSACGKIEDMKYTFNFMVDGELYETVETYQNEEITMPLDPTKEGYLFDGWYWDDTTFSNPLTLNSLWTLTLPQENTFYAKWKVDDDYTPPETYYSVNFLVNDSLYNNALIKEGDNLILPSNPTNSRYTFDGWYLNKECTEALNVNSVVTNDMTIYAGWKYLHTYTINYELIGGEFPSSTQPKSSYTNDEQYILENPIKANYTFAGWYDNKNLTGDAIASFEPVKTQYLISTSIVNINEFNIILYAKWTPTIIEISTKEDMVELSNTPSMWNAHIELKNNIDMSGVDWNPIGNNTTKFTGVFEGNNFSISNLEITTFKNCMGLFGYMKGRVRNLSIDQLNISVDDSTHTCHVGGLAGYVDTEPSYTEDFFISNCHVSGEINSSTSTTYKYIGGLVGALICGKIENSSAKCNIQSSHLTYSYLGGLVGQATSGLQTVGLVSWSIHNTITNCFADCSISVDSCSYLGGLVGSSQATIQNCYSVGQIISNNSTYSGGLLGYSEISENGYVLNSYSSVDLEITTGTAVGGLIGWYRNGKVENCFATGNITSENCSQIGGLVGYYNINKTPNCYRLDVQTLPSGTLNEVGTSSTKVEILEFINNNWDEDIWDLLDSEYPTLYWQKTNN